MSERKKMDILLDLLRSHSIVCYNLVKNKKII